MNRMIGSVEMFEGLDPDGTTFQKCRVETNGTPANAVLYRYDAASNRFIRVDRLTEATVTSLPDGKIEVRGLSDEMVMEIGLTGADAIARWVVTPRGCQTCH